MIKTTQQKRLYAELRPVRVSADELLDELERIASLTYIGVAALTPAGRFYNATRIREASGRIKGSVRLRVGGVILELTKHRTRISIDPKHATGDDESIAASIEAFMRRHQVSVLPSVAVEVLLTLFMCTMVLAVLADEPQFQSLSMSVGVAGVLIAATITAFESAFRRAGFAGATSA
jgi:hypothetical protein